MKILLVASDQALRSQLHQDLSRHNFTVDDVADDDEAWDLLQSFIYEVVVLEAMVPHLDGIALCRRLRAVGNPVLILLITAPADASVRVQGLDSGADACLEKPIQEAELLAHIRALARRDSRRAGLSLTWGPLSLDPMAQQITCYGQVLNANRKEYQILELFLRHPRQMFSRSNIGNCLWTLDDNLPSDATIKSHIRSLRRKLEKAGGADDLIQTHYGQGYRLNPSYDPGRQTPPGELPQPEMTMDSITANLWQELMAANCHLQQEIEHRQQVEAQLRRSETLLRNAQQAAHVGSWEYDLHTQALYWTDELYRIHGLDPGQPPPNPEEVLSFTHPDDRPLHLEAIRAPAMRREPFEVNLRIMRANDGEIRYINARGGPLFDADGNMVKLTGTVLDITPWVLRQQAYGNGALSAKL
jgi:PAS domain S-box-containing protein